MWLLVGLLGIGACKGRELETECIGTGGPSVLVEVRGPDGSPTAIGTTVVIRDGTFVDTGGAWDELRVGAGERRPGHYQVEVFKPGYERVILRDVMAPGDTVCNYAEPTDIRAITLKPLPGAPPVRSIVVLPNSSAMVGPGDTIRLRAVVDAAPGVSRAVRWSSSDTAAATVSPSGLLTARCLPASKDVVITAVSVADPKVRAEGYAWIVSPISLPPPEALIGPGAEEARARQRRCLAEVL
jgi:hypothetical protein